MPLSKEDGDKVIAQMQKKGVKLPCPRCSHPRFSIIDETLLSIQKDEGEFTIGGPAIPTIIVACDNCGFITQHAKRALDR